MHPSAWLAFVPSHLAADVLAHPAGAPLDRELHSDAIALTAELSGFTPMSEALGRSGTRGTEEFSRLLNRTFGALITIIHRAGGSIGKCTGDALLVVFPYEPATQRLTIQRALLCALEMQAVLPSSGIVTTQAGTFHIAMRIGLGMGQLLTTTVGAPDIRLHYLLSGSAIELCAQAVQHATPGTIVVTEEITPFVAAEDTVAHTPGVHQLVRLSVHPQPAPMRTFPTPSLAISATLARFLPAVIANRLARDQHDFIAEHRIITALFARFPGKNPSEADQPNIKGYLNRLIRLCDRYSGTLHQIDVDGTDNRFVVLFGAPLSREDDVERAMQCAQELHTHAQSIGTATMMGITTGQAYCGLIGTTFRRTYTAIGASLNLAARLMHIAQPGQILVDAPTRHRLTVPFHWFDLPPLPSKGKTSPVAIAGLERRQQHTAKRLHIPGYPSPMIGRQPELATAVQHLIDLQQQHGHILCITGAAGMGKSRLVVEVLRATAAQQIAYFVSECHAAPPTSYLVWQTLLRGLFGITPAMPSETQLEQVSSAMRAIDPQLCNDLPLLYNVLQLPNPASPSIGTVDSQSAKESLERMIITCLRHWTQQHPLLLVLEDCQWIDPLSADLLSAVAQSLADLPLLLLVTYRSPETDQEEESLRALGLRTLAHYHELALGESKDTYC